MNGLPSPNARLYPTSAQSTVTTAHQHEAMHHGGEHVFAADQAAVEEGQARAGHHQDQRGADQHPGVVAGGLGGFGSGLNGRKTLIDRLLEE